MTLAAGQSAAQVLGTGTVVSILGATGSTPTAVPINEVSDVKNSGFKTATVTATNFDSLGIARKVATIVDFGTITITTNRVSGSPGQAAVNAAQLTRQSYDFEMQLPINPLAGQTTTGDLVKFSGIVTEAGSFDVSLDAVSQYTFTVELNAWSVTAGT